MGLLNSLTVRYAVDLSALKSGTTEAKDLISSLKSVVQEATTALQAMSTAFNGGELTSQLSSATSSISSLAESASVTGESLLTVGTDAEEMGAEVATGTEEASSGLNTLKTKSEETSTGFGGLVQKVGGGVGSMVSNLLSLASHATTTLLNLGALGQGAISLASSLLAPAASAKEIESSLVIFDGSAAAAHKELQSLADFAAHTPFSTTSIDEAALHLQGVGINAKDVQPDILALGDALDAMGKISAADLQGLVDDFSKIQTQGHLTTDVVNSFALRGIDAWKILETQTGKTRDQLAAYISKGLYPAKDAMHDLTVGIEKSPLYHGQMANDTLGWAGALSNLKANFDQVLVSLGSPVIDGLVPIFNNIGAALSKPEFKDFAGSVGKGIASVFVQVGDAAKHVDFKTIGDQVQQLGNWFKNSLMPAIDQAKPGFEHLATTVGNLANSALPPLLDGVSNLVPQVVTLAGDVSGGLASAIDGISGSFTTWSPIIGGVAIALTVAFIPAIIKAGVDAVIAGAKLTGTFIKGIVEAGLAGWEAAGRLAVFTGGIIATGAKAVWTGAVMTGQFIASMVTAGAVAVANGAKMMVSFVGALIQAGIEAGITAVAFLSDLIPSIISMTAEAIVFAVTAIPGILAGFGSWVVGAVAVGIANLIAFWPIVLVVLAIVLVIGLVILIIKNWGAIISWLGEQWQRFVGFLQTQFALIQKALALAAGWFHDRFTEAWNSITSIFGNIGGWFHDKFNDGMNRVKSVLTGLKNFAQGIWNDIASGVKSALNFAIDQVNNLIRGINFVSGALHIPAIPLIPHLSTGGTIPPGGMAIVGDPGPSSELVYGGQSGATVFSHGQSQAMLAGAGGGGRGDTHVHVYLDSEEIATYSAEAAAEIIIRKVFGHGPVRSGV